jgi:putative Mn2+ efflux pump MntP
VPTLGVVAIALGFDSARASAGLGLRPLTVRRAGCLALAFGAFDGVSSFAGLVAGPSITGALESRVRIAGAVLLAAYGLWLAIEPLEWTPGAQLWVPAILSLDNLGAGVVLAGSGPASVVAVFLGVTSAVFSCVGFWSASFVRERIPDAAARLSGLVLLAIAASQATAVG